MDSTSAQPRSHKYNAATLLSPSVCTACHKFIFGLIKQGLRCENCQNVIHHKCKKLVKINCNKMFPPPKNLHEFSPKTFFTPNYCDQCGSLLWGIYKQGAQCKAESCQVIVHHGCKSLVGSSCGVVPHVEISLAQKSILPVVMAVGLGLGFMFYKLAVKAN